MAKNYHIITKVFILQSVAQIILKCKTRNEEINVRYMNIHQHLEV